MPAQSHKDIIPKGWSIEKSTGHGQEWCAIGGILCPTTDGSGMSGIHHQTQSVDG